MRGTEALAAYPQEISYHEWWRLWSYVSALSISDVEGHSLWLVVNDAKRTWHYETPFMHFELFGGEFQSVPTLHYLCRHVLTTSVPSLPLAPTTLF